jgi:predicted glycoside hydrolase/deacetylase ChbG (UPF0249 family)
MPNYIHADDIGLTKTITDNIIKCYDNGTLTSTSLIINGYAYDYAVDVLKKRNDIRVCIHLNIAEGKSLVDRKEVFLITNERGFFNKSFFYFLFANYFANKQKKTSLKEQIKKEFIAQIITFKRDFNNKPVLIDSHQHYHLIPFIFDVLVEISEELQVKYIRIAKEPFFLHLNKYNDFFSYAGINIIKHFLLNHLSKLAIIKLKNKNILYTKKFIGILFTGKMNYKIVNKILKKTNNKSEEITEFLFHPGYPDESERQFWFGRKELEKYYYSENRKKEQNEIVYCN